MKIMLIFVFTVSLSLFAAETIPMDQAGIGQMPADIIECRAVMGENCPKYIEWKKSHQTPSKTKRGTKGKVVK